MISCIQNYNDELSNKMHRLNSTNPKEFWKIFNKNEKRVRSDISIDTLYTYLKDLNKDNYNDEFDIDNAIFSEPLNDILNSAITREEIVQAVKKAKNNKSPGEDNIVNEYIASSLDIMIEI